MYKFHIFLFSALLLLLSACRKDSSPAPLNSGSISFQYAAGKDTLQAPVSILSDTTTVIKFAAVLAGSTSSSEHWVNFGVDTTKMARYRALYGAAVVLPVSSYYFYKPLVHLAAGAGVSDEAVLNIVQQTKLVEYTTYVLPVVIQSVDGITEGAQSNRVIYYVFKTGKPLFINKTGWTIAAYSSVNSTSVPANLLDDNNLTTFWATNITQQMPQYVTINFNRLVTFSAVNYYLPTALKYPTLGGYPTSIQIETSTDGLLWVNSGIYAGNIVNSMQTLNTGVKTARYLRFTALASVKYSSAYSAVFISGISLVP